MRNFLRGMSTSATKQNGGIAAERAENILCFFYGMCTPPPSSPKSNKEAVYKPKPELEELIAAQNNIHVSPNPADQYVQLEYELLFTKSHTEMHVYDELGRKVSSYTLGENTRGVEILDTRKLVGGFALSKF
jgi:hypothetical protein